MRVKINGKEVEVGPSRTHKENCGCLGKLSQKKTQNSDYHSRLVINGHEVDMNDPDEVNGAILPCRIAGLISIVVGLIIAFFLFNENQFDYDDNMMPGIFMIFIFVFIGIIFFFFVPKSLQKRLQELRKQGRVPSKYGKMNDKGDEIKSLHIQEKNIPQSSPNQSLNCSKLLINGREVEINNPEAIQKIGLIAKKFGLFMMLLGLIFAFFSVFLAIDLIFIGLICRVYIPKGMQKLLQELKKQNKITVLTEDMENIKNDADTSRNILGFFIALMGILIISIMDPDEIRRLNPGIDSNGMIIAYLIPISFIVVGFLLFFSGHSKEISKRK